MRKHLAVADTREIVVHYEVDTVPCRLIVLFGTRRWLLDVAAPDEKAGRPWIYRWNKYARGLREKEVVIRHRCLCSTESLSETMLRAIRAALRFIEYGPEDGTGILTH